MTYVIDVLRGSKDKRILQNKHDQLSTYGIGKDRSVDAWRLLGRSLLHQGLVSETSDGYAVLKLNTHSWEVLRKQRSVFVAVPKAKDTDDRPNSPKRQMAEQLFEHLRALRKQLADEQSVPPYVVFPDSSLRLMAQSQPQSLTDFAQISGVGSRKLDKYGPRFVKAIEDFCQQYGAAQSTSED